MPEIINWSFSVDVTLGPKLAGSDSLTVGAYDKASVVIAAGAADVDVQVQPANVAGKVQVLVLRAETYDPGLTISADGGTTSFPLDGPLVLLGAGAVALLADAPQTLRFGNGTTADIGVDVLIGRDPAP
jgi:hypothetical protein